MLEIRHVQKIRSQPAQRPEQQSQSSADVTDKLRVAQRTLRGYDIAVIFCVWLRRRGLKQPMDASKTETLLRAGARGSFCPDVRRGNRSIAR